MGNLHNGSTKHGIGPIVFRATHGIKSFVISPHHILNFFQLLNQLSFVHLPIVEDSREDVIPLMPEVSSKRKHSKNHMAEISRVLITEAPAIEIAKLDSRFSAGEENAAKRFTKFQ